MKEQIRGYLRNPNELASLENLDSDTEIYLKRATSRGQNYEFGTLDFRDNSIIITLEMPDSASAGFESYASWWAKRKWYVDNAPTSLTLFREGVADGYLAYEESELGISEDLLAEEYESEKQNELELLHEELLKRWRKDKKKEKYNEKRRIERQSRKKIVGKFQKTFRIRIRKSEENPWKVYEKLKSLYCSAAQSVKEYDEKTNEILFALGL